MSPRTIGLDDRLYAYYRAVGLREHPALAALREDTDALEHGSMRSSAEQTQLLAFLAELTGARRVLEVGCFTGYTTLGLALALPEDGRVVTLDVNDHWAEIGRRRWEEADVADRIQVRLGLAADSLRALLDEGAAGAFDMAYVDADKKGYGLYAELALELVRPGGIVALDNVLWGGRLADPAEQSRQAVTLREVNARLHADPRVALVMLPIGDGLTLARKR